MLSLRSLVVAVAVGALFAGGLTAQSGSRFDATVRGDFFAGLTGDVARLQQAMAACERMLADDPANAEALVWHGSGLYFQAGQLFRAGDAANGAAMAGRARQEMDSAVARDPDNIGVRIPRGATLLEAARQMGPGAAAPLLTTAIEDYEHVLKLQERVFSTLSDHAKGELLFGLADGYARLGDLPRSRAYLAQLTREAPGSARAGEARQRLERGGASNEPVARCSGCHA